MAKHIYQLLLEQTPVIVHRFTAVAQLQGLGHLPAGGLQYGRGSRSALIDRLGKSTMVQL